MLKINCLVIAISALIVVFGADPFYEIGMKLYRNFNNYRISAYEVEVKLTSEVEVANRDEVMVGYISVAQILSYKDRPCSLKHLADFRVASSSYEPESEANIGVGIFIRNHLPGLKKSCAENFFNILKEAVAAFPLEDKQILDGLQIYTKKKWFSKSNNGLEKLAEESMNDWKQDKRFQSCVKLIEKLSIPMSFRGWKEEKPDKSDREFFTKWYGILETCKIYTETQCRRFYRRDDPMVSSRWFASPVDHGDEFFDQKTKCNAIVKIGMSDKYKRELDAKKERY